MASPDVHSDYDSDEIESLCGAYRGAGPLSRPFYVSPEVFKADIDRIWRRHWLYAGHSCLIPQPGDWITWAVGHDSVIVARGKDGDIRAFHNTCRHRGSRICREEQGHGRAFVCPYHAWTYDLDGSLRTATEREFGVHQSKLGLHPVPLKNYRGAAFRCARRQSGQLRAGGRRHRREDEASGPRGGEAREERSLHREGQLEAHLREQPRVLSLHDRASRIHPRHLRHRALLAADALPEVERQERLAAERFARMGLGDATASSEMTGGYWRATRSPVDGGLEDAEPRRRRRSRR